MKAVAKWRHEPPMENGRALSVWNLVNVTNVSVDQQKYCRIRELPVANSASEEIHDFAEVFLPLDGDAALRKMIAHLDSDNSGARRGNPGMGQPQGQPQSVVQVRSDIYMVRHERIFANWRVETDRAGEIWCVHVGPGHRIN